MKVTAFERSAQGTGASRRLRKAGKTPGIIYGGTAAPQAIELDHNALYHALKKEAFHASILDLELAGQSQKVLLRDFQLHPFKQLVLHADFQRVDPNKKVHVKMPLHFVKAELAPAVKSGGASITHVLTELNIQCLPGDLPEFIEVDLSKVEIGQSIHAKDLTLPNGVSLVQYIELENPVVVSAKLLGAEKETATAAPVSSATAAEPPKS
ncbi:MAG: 50S ribosomal protein L25/general stress protein Ctc [Ottowia sp.]|nr:50S ribosomal protein L25/general stress protein Ctc [Ottowia sp.]